MITVSSSPRAGGVFRSHFTLVTDHHKKTRNTTKMAMQAWGDPDREAIHTGTFYGDPLGAAAAMATLAVIERETLCDTAAERGAQLASVLAEKQLPHVTEVREAGLMLGLQLDRAALGLTVTRALLERGYLVLPAGAEADVIQLSPPATIHDAQLDGFVDALERSLAAL